MGGGRAHDAPPQVMPPSVEEKFRKWPGVQANLDACGIAATAVVRKHLEAFTFAEFQEYVDEFSTPGTGHEVAQRIENAYKTCTLNTAVSSDDNTLWSKVCEDQAAKFIRVRKAKTV